MKRFKIIRYKRALIFSIFTATLLFTSLNFNSFIINSLNDYINDDNEDNIEDIPDIPWIKIKTAAYETGRSNSNTGANIKIIAHQSLKNDSYNLAFSNISQSNDFKVPCPTSSSFNSSLTNFTIENIYAPNKTLILEDQGVFGETIYYQPCAAGFKVYTKCYFVNFSIILERSASPNNLSSIQVRLLRSQWTGSQNRPITTGAITLVSGVQVEDHTGWYYNWSDSFSPQLIDPENTANNTFYIEVSDTGDLTVPPDTCSWTYEADSSGIDSMTPWKFTGGSWQVLQGPGSINVDLTCRVDLAPLSNTPKPTGIELRINNSDVNNINNGSGYWLKQNQNFTDADGELDFKITSDWWDVSCDITKVQVNYTKVDLSASSAFDISSSGQQVNWNITVDGMGVWGFDGDTDEWNYINFTIPDQWSLDGVYKGGTPQTYMTFGSPGPNWIITATGAGNGTYWYLNAHSDNLLLDGDHGIQTKVGSEDNLAIVNYTNTIDLIANFTKTIQNPNEVNMTIYDSSLTQQVHSEVNNTFSSNKIHVDSWEIFNDVDVVNYGIYTIQAYWNNATDAGFVEKNITIMADTALELSDPSLPIEKHSYDPAFNITVFYNDTGRGGIAIDTINVSYSDPDSSASNYGTMSPDPINGAGYYNYTINPANYGPGYHMIEIQANKTYYNKKILTITINIMNSTAVYGPSRIFSIKNYESVIYTFSWNDTDNSNKGISNSSGTVSIGSWKSTPSTTNFIYDSWEVGSGNYTINITAWEVPASLTYEVNFTISRSGFEQVEVSFSITINIINTNITFRSVVDDNYKRNTGLDYSAELYINRTDTTKHIAGLNETYIEVTYSGNLWPDGDVELIDDGDYYTLNLSISNINSGSYIIMVNFSLAGVYNWSMVLLNLTLIGNTSHVENFTLLQGSTVLSPSLPGDYYASTIGLTLTIRLNISDEDNNWNLVFGATPSITVFYNWTSGGGQTGTLSSTLYSSDGSGYSGTINMDTLPGTGNYTITIIISTTNFENAIYEFKISMSSGGTDGNPFWLVILLIFALIGIVGTISIYGGYRKIVVPKKIAKRKVLTEVESVFDDAVNLEHVLVLYKNTGMCVFFKSFGLEEIDPELISGFLSAVSSFGKEMESTQALNEIRYGDKQILLSDGEYIRVALVLGKKPSVVTRQHLSEFIKSFEKYFSKALPDWRGNLKVFQGAGKLIDSILNTSIILPHEIKFSLKVAKSLKKPNSKEVLKIAQNLVKDSERQYFFIGQLLTLAVEKLGKEKAEVFIGIKELRDSGLLAPIEITAIEAPPISQQELDLIGQRVNKFTTLSNDEKQRLMSDIAAISNPIEREAYITSLAEHHEIVSGPADSTRKVLEVKDEKSAKKEIAKLIKKGQSAKKSKNYKDSIQILKDAAEIATNFELQKIHDEINDEIRLISILDLEIKKKNFEEQAKKAIKTVKYKDAAQFYKLASDTASKIFKLGRTDAMKEVKRLTNKSKEYEKLAEK
ncbi:MAG: hypothetical protein ACFFBP_03720 [Promethearchaeota archaeon]